MTADTCRRLAGQNLQIAAESHAKGQALLDLAREFHDRAQHWLEAADEATIEAARAPTSANVEARRLALLAAECAYQSAAEIEARRAMLFASAKVTRTPAL